MNEKDRLRLLAKAMIACSQARKLFSHDQFDAGVEQVRKAEKVMEQFLGSEDSFEYRRAHEHLADANQAWANAL